MGAFSCCLAILWRRVSAAKGRSTDGKRGGVGYDAEPPLSRAELIAAAAFLDFGGMLDERWLSGQKPHRQGMDCRHRD
jgi:hypothetical protein